MEHIMRKVGPENLILTGNSECNRSGLGTSNKNLNEFARMESRIKTMSGGKRQKNYLEEKMQEVVKSHDPQKGTGI